MPEIKLKEQTETIFSLKELDEGVAIEICNKYNDKIGVQFPTPICPFYTLRPGGFIGHISLSDDTIIHIEPKVPISNIFLMLEYAYDLKSFQLLEGTVELNDIEQLYEILASILAKMVLDRYRKGLYRDYVKREDSLPYLKGRLLINQTIKASNRGSINLECEYCENTSDVIDNRILAWTLYRIPRLNIQREEVRKQLRQSYRAVSSSVEVSKMNPEDCVNRFYHRLNEDYQPMHALCRFFLEQCGPLTSDGDHEFIPFILNMNILFESFVAKWLEEHLPDDIKIKAQYTDNLSPDGVFSIRIDLVLMDLATGKVLAVLDTKYKNAQKPTIQDISQTVLYAVHMNTTQAFLIYPSDQTDLYTLPIKSVRVTCLRFDISKNLEEAGQIFLNDLLQKLER